MSSTGTAERARVAAARLLHPAAAEAERVAMVSSDVLRAIAVGLGASIAEDERGWVPARHRTFVRVLATPAYEAWLIEWAPSSALELHDHGGARGAIHVVRGQLAETYTERDVRTRIRTRTLHAGSSVAIPSERVHEVWNPGPADALSVHVYSPPLSTMTFYGRDADGALSASRTVDAESSAGSADDDGHAVAQAVATRSA